MCTWDPGLEEVHEFGKKKPKKKKVPESKPKGLEIEKNRAQTLKTIEKPPNKQTSSKRNPKPKKNNQTQPK